MAGAVVADYLREARAMPAHKSRLPLSTDEPLYKRIANRSRCTVECMEPIIDYTLVECVRVRNGNQEVLLGLKKRGFGINKWNGFGGKIEVGETAAECASRELTEECGVVAKTLEWRAQLLFTFRDSPKLMRVHVFVATSFEGDPVETEEMKPKWFSVDHLPLSDMWHDDQFWMHKLIAGETFHAWFDYLAGGETVNTVAQQCIIPVPNPKTRSAQKHNCLNT